MQSVRILPRLSVIDGRLLRQYPRSMGIDISKDGSWALTVMEKAPAGQTLVNTARGHGKIFAMKAILEMMKQYKINAVYEEASRQMWAPPVPMRFNFD